MHVSAVGLVDGEVLAGPVATDARGHYRLGFRKAPKGNFRVIALVPAKPKDPAFTYATLVAPSPAPSDAPVVTSDSSRAVVSYILGVMPARLQPVVDARKEGTSAEAYIARYDDMIAEVGINVYRALDQALAKIPVDKLKEMDGPTGGAITLAMSNRAIQFVDLSKPVYHELNDLIIQGHAYGVASATRPDSPLEDQIVELGKVPAKTADIAPLLVKFGVSQADADAYLASCGDWRQGGQRHCDCRQGAPGRGRGPHLRGGRRALGRRGPHRRLLGITTGRGRADDDSARHHADFLGPPRPGPRDRRERRGLRRRAGDPHRVQADGQEQRGGDRQEPGAHAEARAEPRARAAGQGDGRTTAMLAGALVKLTASGVKVTSEGPRADSSDNGLGLIPTTASG